MSWRGSADHTDANVPDYQKMLQGRYPSSGWSSIPSLQTSYASGANTTSQPGHYMTSRPGVSSYDRHDSPHSYTNSYQPSKYGLTSNYRSLESNLNTLEIEDESPYLSDRKAYIDKNYGIVAREFDLGPFRSRGRKEADYSSDSGSRRLQSRPADYSSDSGMGYRSHRPKSAEFDIDLPSPTLTDRGQNEELFVSPIKSQRQGIDEIGYSDNQPLYSDGNTGSSEHFQNYSPHPGPVSSSTSSHTHHSQTSERDTKTSGQIEGYGTSKDSQNLNLNSHDTHDNNWGRKEDQPVTVDNGDRRNFFSPPMYKGDVGGSSVVNNGSSAKGNRTDDLTHWQRQHQQSQSATVDDHSPRETTYRQYSRREKNGTYQGYTHDSLDGDERHSPRGQNGRDLSPRPHQKSSSHRHINLPAAETIIRDKDAIIEELKGELDVKLEQISKYENELRRAQSSRQAGNHTDVSPTFSKMQDLEYRNSELRSELRKFQKLKLRDVEELEIKLGGAEHEIDQLKAALKKSQPNLMGMKEKMYEKEKEVEEWKSKCGVLNKKYEQLEEKVGGLERYLSDLPTIEEFTRTAEELASCREDNEVKTEQLEALEKRLAETTQMLSERESNILEMEEKQQQLGSKMRELSSEIKHIRSGGDGRALLEAREQLAETREVKDRVVLDLEKAKKLLEMNHRRMRQLEAKHQTDVRQMEERLGQEEESVLALREETHMKEEQIESLKKSLKELASKKQDLRHENLVLKEQLQQAEQLSAGDESVKLQRRVVKEMTVCFTELNALAQICIQRAEGKDPNVSLLLGMKGMTTDEEEEEGAGAGAQDEQTLKHWVAKVKELRMEVERVRKMICNKYAEEMGDNLNCATQ